MRRFKETTEDVVTYVDGGTIFTVVAALTAAVMAIGLGAIEPVERLRRRI